MLDPQVVEGSWPWFQLTIEWVGFSVLAGLSAKAILPGRDPGGALATIAIGLLGVVVGSGGLTMIVGNRISPISPYGFLAATGGAFVLLLMHRLLSGGTFFHPKQQALGGVVTPQSGKKSLDGRHERRAA